MSNTLHSKPNEGSWFARYGAEVENYLEVYMKTPNLPKKDMAKALLARGNARKAAGDRLLVKANLGACREI